MRSYWYYLNQRRLFRLNNVAAAYNTVAILHEERLELSAAEKWYSKAYEVWEQAEWPLMMDSVKAIDNLVQNLRNQDKLQDVGALLDKSVDQLERIVGPQDESLARRLNDVAAYHGDRGNDAQAHEYYLCAIDIWAKNGWPNQPVITNLLFNAVGTFLSRGYGELAEKTARQSVAHAKKWLNPQDIGNVEPLFTLAMVLRHRNAFPECERVLKEALKLIDSGPGDSHPFLPGVLSSYAELLQRIGKRSGKAKRMEKNAAERLRNK